MLKKYRSSISTIHKLVLIMFLMMLLATACGDSIDSTLSASQVSPSSTITTTGSNPTTLGVATLPAQIPIKTPPPTATATATTATSPKSWAELGNFKPQYLYYGGANGANGSSIVDSHTNPQRLAYCASDGIRYSENSGKSWSSISTSGITMAAVQAKFQAPEMVVCLQVLFDPKLPNSFYAVFNLLNINGGNGDPLYPSQVGFVTSDKGKSWRLIPAPAGYAAGENAGLRVSEQSVEVLFRPNGQISAAANFGVNKTSDGGDTWQESRLTCQPNDACVQWGPEPAQRGMGPPRQQSVIFSTDNGQTWRASNVPPIEVRASQANQLAISGNQVLLVASHQSYPASVILSQDAGQTWTNLALPPLPENNDLDHPYPGLQMLPDSGLISHNANRWYRLMPQAQSWCVLSSKIPNFAVAYSQNGIQLYAKVLNDRLWWVDTKYQAQSVAVGDLQCQK